MTETVDASPEAGDSMPAPRERAYRATFGGDMSIRTEQDGSAVLFGHFARFNEWTEINSRYEGHFMERIAPGAFSKTFSERGDKIKVLFNHGHDVIGKQTLGSVTELREDDAGAYYEVRLNDGIPPLLLDGLRNGQYGASFQFRAMREDKNQKAEKSTHNPRGIPERTVLEAAVPEFGPVTFPAYAGATSGVRSVTDDVLFAIVAPEIRSALEEQPADDDSAPSTEQAPAAEVTPAPERRGDREKKFKSREDWLEWLSTS